MSNTTLKQEAIAPFIKLLETNGMLHSERFVGMGIHDEKLFLLKESARPERVVVSDKAFAFLNKKADGPAFHIRNGQSRDVAAKEYAFHGKEAGGFTDVMMVPETDMHRTLMISALKKGLEAIERGEKPDEGEIIDHLFTEAVNHPGVVDFVMAEDPSISREEATFATDMLGDALAGLAQGNAQPQQPVDFGAAMGSSEQPQAQAQATPEPEPAPRREAPKSGGTVHLGPWGLVAALVDDTPLFSKFGWA